MKITDEQALRAHKLLREAVYEYGNGLQVFMWTDEVKALLAEIDRTNEPPEIRWCVKHDAVGFGDGCCCANNPCYMPRREKCEIVLYIPKKREE